MSTEKMVIVEGAKCAACDNAEPYLVNRGVEGLPDGLHFFPFEATAEGIRGAARYSHCPACDGHGTVLFALSPSREQA